MDSVRVAIRVRPLVKSELDRGCSNCVLADPINHQLIVNNNANLTFTFNYVFTPEHSQNQVYELAVEDLVKKLFSGNNIFCLPCYRYYQYLIMINFNSNYTLGYNVTILAYGQTGSGKTHSMGTNFVDNDTVEEKGIIPRAIQHIFNEVQQKADEAKFSIKASFIEVFYYFNVFLYSMFVSSF